LAGQSKLGFYPASPVAIEALLKHLSPCANPVKRPDTYILDPCCGEGAAIQQIAEGLGVAEDNVYCVELDAGRVEATKARMPQAHVLGPASYIGTQITGFSFGLAYVNSPFDNELGGGRREEQTFAQIAVRQLMAGGVLVLVCPIHVVIGKRTFVEYLDSALEETCIYKFPDGHRHYKEIVVIGKKRKVSLPSSALEQHGCLHQMRAQYGGYVREENIPALGQPQPVHWRNGYPSYDRETDLRVWEVQWGYRPGVFKKTAFTDEELTEAIQSSPLNTLLDEVPIPPPKRPPLPLDKGHLGLILASGMLDGVVEGPHGPHVVRGSSTKVQYHNKEQSRSEFNEATGAVTTKDVFSQRMVTIIRAVGQDGEIRTFSNEVKEDEQSEEVPDGDDDVRAREHDR
jgi:hypothetical protein